MAKKTNKRFSSRDVAKQAGVSQATVSRVFTPGKQVSQDKRRRVLEAAENLNYTPSVIARSLIQNSTKIVAIVLQEFENPFYARALDLCTRRLQSLGYSVLLLDINGTHGIEDTLPIALQYQVDGLIVTSATLSSAMADECRRFETPVVLLNRLDESGNLHTVCTDNRAAGRQIADYLLSNGHRRISYIAGKTGNLRNRNRETGFIERLNEAEGHLYSRTECNPEYHSGLEAARNILFHKRRPTAVFCSSDYTAMALIDVAKNELGLCVPEDISVVGFDDIPMAALPGYNLTTYRQCTERLVDSTIDVLLEALENPEIPVMHRFLPGRLVERGTVTQHE